MYLYNGVDVYTKICSSPYAIEGKMLKNIMSPHIDYASPLVARSYLFFKVVFQHEIKRLRFFALVLRISLMGAVNPIT